MTIFAHPESFKAIYLQFLSTWRTLRDTVVTLDERLQTEPNRDLYEGSLEHAYEAWEIEFQCALYDLHSMILQACHDHCVAPPDWLDRGLDSEETEFPALPFRCACGLDHNWEFHPQAFAPSTSASKHSCPSRPKSP